MKENFFKLAFQRQPICPIRTYWASCMIETQEEWTASSCLLLAHGCDFQPPRAPKEEDAVIRMITLFQIGTRISVRASDLCKVIWLGAQARLQTGQLVLIVFAFQHLRLPAETLKGKHFRISVQTIIF